MANGFAASNIRPAKPCCQNATFPWQRDAVVFLERRTCVARIGEPSSQCHRDAAAIRPQIPCFGPYV